MTGQTTCSGQRHAPLQRALFLRHLRNAFRKRFYAVKAVYEAALPGNGAGRRQYGRCCATSLGWRLSARRWPLSAQLTAVYSAPAWRPAWRLARLVQRRGRAHPAAGAARCGTDWRLVVLQVYTVAACLLCTVSLEAVSDPTCQVSGPSALSDSSELCIWRVRCLKACTCAVRMPNAVLLRQGNLSAPATNDPAMLFWGGGVGGGERLSPGRCVLSAVMGGACSAQRRASAALAAWPRKGAPTRPAMRLPLHMARGAGLSISWPSLIWLCSTAEHALHGRCAEQQPAR